MVDNQTELKNHVLKLLNDKHIEFQIHEFESGATLVDVWMNNKFYAIQFKDKFVGISMINDMHPGFSTVPDESFSEPDKFLLRFNEIMEGH
ncbi:MAG: hypothetical protein EOO43_05835 [Flavobacterium sp.]|nr:MAG: hypothetical protein EOO43_05835 [Flavobacterium sp.]